MESLPLLATKLYTPTPRPGLISRPNLLTHLNEGLNGKLTLISAPVGFGKTTLLSEWVASRRSAMAWVSLDAGDNNPALFWRYVITALQQIEQRIGAAALAALHADQPPKIDLLLSGLINEICQVVAVASAGPLILILDDYHTITSSEIHEGLFFLVENLPPGMHIVIASRTDPPWLLSRLRVRQELTELRARDLRFTRTEVRSFLNEAMEFGLAPQEVDALDERTEGWAAGLQMAALALRGSADSGLGKARGDVASYISTFGGSHRFILDYLLEEVLEQQPAYIQAFLLQTAVLDRLTADLCNAVVERHDSQAILAQLEQANLFLVPLDDERCWYRYHHLFSDLLRQRLGETQAELEPELHRRASKWYEEQGLIAIAVDHALAADDLEQVTRLAEENVLGMMESGGLGHIAAWLKALPDEVVHAWPWLCTACAWALAHAGRFQDAMGCAEQLQEIAKRGAEDMDMSHIFGHVNAVRLYVVAMTFHDWENATAYGENALALLPANDMRTRGLVAVLLGFVQRTNHHYAEARAGLSRALAASRAAGEAYALVDLLCQLARVDEQQGHLRQAAATCHEAIRQAEPEGPIHGQSLPVVSYAHGTLAGILLEWHQLEAALHHARIAESLSQQWGHFDSWIESQQLLALILQALGRSAEALALLRKTKHTFDSAAYVDRHVAYLRLADGDLQYAATWADEVALSFSDSVTGYHLANNFLLTRIRIAQFRQGLLTSLDDVIDRLECQYKQLRALDATRWSIRVLVLRSIALQATNQVDEALLALEGALTLAEPEGYVHTFIREGDPMCRLLRKAARGASARYVVELLAAFEPETERVSAPAKSVAVRGSHSLSERELQVLRLLRSSLTSTEIAGELVVAPSTVRSHIKNIYRKLDVHSRMEAVQRGQELGIL